MTTDSWREIERLRLDNFNQMFQTLSRDSAFYRQKYAQLQGTSFAHLDDIRAIPLTEKVELQGKASYLRDGYRPTGYFESSGTTGAPLVGYPDLSFDKALAFGKFLDEWMGLKTAHVDLAVVALGYEMSPVGMRFQQALQAIGITVVPLGVRSTMCTPMRSVDIILRTEPQAIFSRPWELLRYGDVIQETAPEALDMQKVFYLGEVMSRRKRERIKRLWNGADVHGHYGLTELDTGLQTCELGNYHEPETPFMHAELLDLDLGSGAPITAPGMRGQLVISTLRDTAAPLLRYRTGDVASRTSCSCGLRSPAYRIFGRVIDQAHIAGVPLFPCELEDRVLSVPAVGNEFSFVLEDDGGLTLRLERDRGVTLAHSNIEDEVRATLPPDVERATRIEMFEYGELADKLGIAKKKSGQFIDLRKSDPGARASRLALNIVDSAALMDLSPCAFERTGAPLATTA